MKRNTSRKPKSANWRKPQPASPAPLPANLPAVSLVLLSGTSMISRAIQVQTRGMISHAMILFGDGTVYEAREFRGVQRRRWGQDGYADDGWVVLAPISSSQIDAGAMRRFCERQLGKDYDYRSVFRFLTLRRSDGHPGKWFCSEFAATAFAAGRYPLFLRIEPHLIAPRTLMITPRLRMVAADGRLGLTPEP